MLFTFWVILDLKGPGNWAGENQWGKTFGIILHTLTSLSGGTYLDMPPFTLRTAGSRLLVGPAKHAAARVISEDVP